MTTPRTITTADGDRRLSEYWLQEVIEMALYHRFCRKDSSQRALILHGSRDGSYPDFALLDANQTLILVEIKYGHVSLGGAREAHGQLAGYMSKYRQLTLQDHATWYCRHGVDVAVSFEYRRRACLRSDGKSRYGKLIHYGTNNVEYYLEGADDPERALQILGLDYARVVGGTLDISRGSKTFSVSRCILIAQADWPPGFVCESVDGVEFERWSYRAPETWIEPVSSHT
jgi:hypothetical protein